MSSPTFKNLLDFVLTHKGNTTFIGYSDYQIAGMLCEGIDNQLLYYATSSDGSVVGMILAKLTEVSRVVWVEENLSISLSNLKMFALKAKQQFPDYNFQGFKRGSTRNFNRLFDRLTQTK